MTNWRMTGRPRNLLLIAREEPQTRVMHTLGVAFIFIATRR